uniref:Uncharacterized protein n=1 Tax=Octopus bimaculoides TaxID=37653 RepID=A0A0L8I911_OCTBM
MLIKCELRSRLSVLGVRQCIFSVFGTTLNQCRLPQIYSRIKRRKNYSSDIWGRRHKVEFSGV